MEHFIYLLIILLGVVLFLSVWVHEKRRLRKAKQEKEEIEIEEQRMFHFLHGLGEVLLEGDSPAQMHRYITEGVTKVVGARAGIMYLIDNQQDRIIPVAQTAKTAPVVQVPDELRGREHEAGALRQYRSYIRLSALKPGQGVIGQTLLGSKVVSIDDLADFFQQDGSETFHRGVSLLVAPLIFANKKIGAIAVTRKKPFSSNDRDVFASVSEQCSLTLGSAIIHAEVEEKRRLERDLDQASEIQRILLPQQSPEYSDFRLAAVYQPARQVSGDYYDYLRVDQDHFGVAIADVCGKGIAASLIMAMCRSILRSHSNGNRSPADVLRKVNHSIFSDIREDMFVSFLYLIFERNSPSVSLASAGHEPPLVRRAADGTIEILQVRGMAVGVDDGPVFDRVVNDFQFELAPGDVALLYTDGVIEAARRDGEEFGIERLIAVFKETPDAAAPEILANIMKRIREFTSGLTAADDITLIAVEKR